MRLKFIISGLTSVFASFFALSAGSVSSASSLPSMMQKEIDHINAHLSGDKDPLTIQESKDAINFLNSIYQNKHHYAVLRLNSFIPYYEVPDPRPFHYDYFHGDGRGFSPDALSSRTSQDIIIDLNTHQVKTVNYVGETIEYDMNWKIKSSARASSSGMQVNVASPYEKYFDGKYYTNLYASEGVSNPLGDFLGITAPPIHYNVQFLVNYDAIKNKGHVIFLGYTKVFPAYEMYIRKDNDNWITLDTYMPDNQYIWNPTTKLWSGERLVKSGPYDPSKRIYAGKDF